MTRYPNATNSELGITTCLVLFFKRTQLIQTSKYVVAVEVEMVIPADDPSEPCYEPATV